MPPTLIKATYNDYSGISLFTESLFTIKGNSMQGGMCSSFTPCYFAIKHIKYHIKYPAGATCIPSLECCLYFYIIPKPTGKTVLTKFHKKRGDECRG